MDENEDFKPSAGTSAESYALGSAASPLSCWLDLFAADPNHLRLAARLVGWALYLERDARYGAALADPARRQALHYLQARPLRIVLTQTASAPRGQGQTPGDEAQRATALGLRALERLAAIYAPSTHTRVVMMLPPDSGVPGLGLPEADAVSAAAQRHAAPVRLARLWHAAQRWATRLRCDTAAPALASTPGVA